MSKKNIKKFKNEVEEIKVRTEASAISKTITDTQDKFYSIAKLSENEEEKELIAQILNLMSIYRIKFG